MFQRIAKLWMVTCLTAGALCAATDPFIGEWKVNPSKSTLIDRMKVEGAPGGKYAFDFGSGTAETIATDGTDQPGLAGTTLSVTVEGPRAWKVVRKKDGRTLLLAHWKLSEDEKTLNDDFTGFGGNGSKTNVQYAYKRTAGTSGFEGTWQNKSETVTSAFVLKVQPYEDDGLSFVYPAQDVTKNLKFDGKDYPIGGLNAAKGSVASARRVNNDRLEITDKIDGKTADTQQVELSSDLRTLTITVHPVGQRDGSIFVFERQ